jgi:hypothetical protein
MLPFWTQSIVHTTVSEERFFAFFNPSDTDTQGREHVFFGGARKDLKVLALPLTPAKPIEALVSVCH